MAIVAAGAGAALSMATSECDCQQPYTLSNLALDNAVIEGEKDQLASGDHVFQFENTESTQSSALTAGMNNSPLAVVSFSIMANDPNSNLRSRK